MPNFSSNKHFGLFKPNLPKKGISGLEHQHQFHHNEIRLGTKIDLKQEILFFLPNLPTKGRKMPRRKILCQLVHKILVFSLKFFKLEKNRDGTGISLLTRVSQIMKKLFAG